MWEPSTAPIVIVSPHPDDETLATGGLIAWATERGIDVQVLAVTDGQNAYHDSVGLGPIRQREQEQALKALSVGSDRILRLHITDSDISSHVVSRSVGLRFERLRKRSLRNNHACLARARLSQYL